MKCVKCGNNLTGDENFCRICGEPLKKSVEEVHENKWLELTDNIDVSKVEIENKSSISVEDDTIEVKPLKENNSDEFSAMLELTKVDESKKEPYELTDNSKGDISDIPKDEDNGSSKTIVDEILHSSSDSSDEIKKILQEFEPENNDNNKELDDDLNEPTVLIPKDLIKSYEKNKKEVVDDNPKEKNESVNEDNEISENADKKVDDNDKISIDEKEESSVESNTIEGIEQKAEISEEVSEKSIEKLVEEKYNSIEKNEISNDSSTISSIPEKKEEPLSSENKQETPETNVNKQEEIIDNSIQELPVNSNITSEPTILDSKINDAKLQNNNLIDKDKKKKDSSHFGIILLVILLVLCICVVAYFGILLMASHKQYDKISDEKTKLEKEITTLQTSNSNTSNDNTKEEQISNPSSLSYEGYSISLESFKDYSLSDGNLILNSEDSTIIVSINSDVVYSDIKADKDSYRKLHISNNYIVDSYGTKVASEKEYVVYEMSDTKNIKYLVAYTELDDTTTIAFVILNQSNTIDYDVLETTNSIVTGIKKENSTKNYNFKLFDEE